MKNNEDAAILLLIDCEELQKHQMFDVKTMTAVVNVSGLRSDDAKKYRWRIERMIMRSVATLFGIKAAPDPHCVTRDYHSLDELDKMGRNYTPPYILTVERKAKELGLGVGQ